MLIAKDHQSISNHNFTFYALFINGLSTSIIERDHRILFVNLNCKLDCFSILL